MIQITPRARSVEPYNTYILEIESCPSWMVVNLNLEQSFPKGFTAQDNFVYEVDKDLLKTNK